MFVWGIFMSHEDRNETIHDDKFHYDLFATENEHLSILKNKKNGGITSTMILVSQMRLRRKSLVVKSQTNPFAYSKSLPKSAAKKTYGFLLAITFPQLEPRCAKESWQKNYQ